MHRHFTVRSGIRSLQKNGIAYQRNFVEARIFLQLFTEEDLRSKISAVTRTQIGISLLHRRITAPVMDPAEHIGFRYAP